MSDPYIGEIRMFGGNFAPRGWAFCQGQLLSIQQNTALFSLLGTMYGGNGQTTFGLPDLRGRSPVGIGQGPGLSPITEGEMAGTENVTLTQTQMPMHTHAMSGATASVAIPVTTEPAVSKTPSATSILSTANENTGSGAEVDIYGPGPATTTLEPFNAAVTGSVAAAGGSQPVGIRNPYIGINFIIALEGVYPSRN
jgi:microcystin-dependent protein